MDGDTALDGNAVAGLFGEMFARDMTVASITCDGCGTTAPLGALRDYGGTMGAVLRCATCDTAVVRLTRTPAGYWLEMQATRRIFVPAKAL